MLWSCRSGFSVLSTEDGEEGGVKNAVSLSGELILDCSLGLRQAFPMKYCSMLFMNLRSDMEEIKRGVLYSVGGVAHDSSLQMLSFEFGVGMVK